jgi:hypothetical protein
MSEEPRFTTSADFLREIVANYQRDSGKQPTKPARRLLILRKRFWIPLATIVIVCSIWGLFVLDQKSAWEQERRAIERFNKPDLVFVTEQVYPEWLCGKYGLHVVGLKYSPKVYLNWDQRELNWDQRELTVRGELAAVVAPLLASEGPGKPTVRGQQLGNEEIARIKSWFPYIHEADSRE